MAEAYSWKVCYWCGHEFIGCGPMKFCSAKCIFDSLVEVRKDDECWPWRGRFFKQGYGQFKFRNRTMKAHRTAYESYCGPIREGMEVTHLCNNKWCCNYKQHLIQKNHSGNMKDLADSGKRERVSNSLLDKAISEYFQGKSFSRVGRELGISKTAVQRRMRKRGIAWRTRSETYRTIGAINNIRKMACRDS
jgi:HNH endonuclease